MSILVIDNYDSFVYNLVHLLEGLGCSDVVVRRNDKITLEEVERFDKILLSPGPGIPMEAGVMPDVVRRYAPTKSIFGVCLGHQCIGEVFGGTLINMGKVCHGQGLPTRVVAEDELLFRDMPRSFISARYHSWMVQQDNLPPDIEVTAIDDDGRIMALRHREYDVRGVQFHPESVLTEHGGMIVRNWLEGSR